MEAKACLAHAFSRILQMKFLAQNQGVDEQGLCRNQSMPLSLSGFWAEWTSLPLAPPLFS